MQNIALFLQVFNLAFKLPDPLGVGDRGGRGRIRGVDHGERGCPVPFDPVMQGSAVDPEISVNEAPEEFS